MMKRGRSFNFTKRKRFATSGFTITEMIVVIAVIAILAAVTIVAFNGIQRKAHASQASAALADAKKKLIVYKLDNGAFPTSGNLGSAGVVDDKVTYQYTGTSATDFCLTATADDVSYYIGATTPKDPVEGGCPGHGQGGVTAITNVVTNPSFETNINGVAGYYSSPLVRVTTAAAYGTAYVSTTTNSAINPQGLVLTITNSSAPALTYTCSVSYKGTVGASVLYSGRANTSGGAYIGESYGSKTLTMSGSWQRANITFTTPANTGVAFVQLRINPAQTGATIAADGLMCVNGSTTYSYADGDSADWIWNGTAHASSSTGPAL